DPLKQRQAIGALVQLGDARAADAFLDRLSGTDAESALTKELLPAAGQFRRPESAARLLQIAEQSALRTLAFGAALTVSGFDQRIDDPDEEGSAADRDWEKKQHPRPADILA